MFKKRVRPQAKRVVDSEEDETEEKTEVITAIKRKRTDNLTAQTTGSGTSSTKRNEDEQVMTKERVMNDIAFGGIKTTNETLHDAGDKSGVFAVMEVDTNKSHDHRAILERNQQISEQLISGELKEGVYRGMGGYKQIISRSKDTIAAGKYTGTLGPIRGSTSGVKLTCRFDYWGTSGDGGVCREYKDTGYCGYGDSCIYMHDRSDYKSGWRLEQEYAAAEKERNKKLEERLARKADPDAPDESESESSDNEDEMPRDCHLCGRKWNDCESMPVVTQCRHYFCENCALERYQDDKRCQICTKNTNGIFNQAEKHLERKRDRREQRLLQEAAPPPKQDFSNYVPYQIGN